ncbi:MAG: hypothetical protein ACFN02_04590 [Olsenella profusa]
MRRAIPLGDVIDLRRSLAEVFPAATVHLHDACGGQTLSLEAAPEELAGARDRIEAFFAARHVRVAFDTLGTTFWVADPGGAT